MSDILGNGASALLTFQRALSTTSQNIANANTEGYSRQRINLESVGNSQYYQFETGSGVRVTNIERLQDEFATGQVLQTTSALAKQSTHLDMAGRIDSFMADGALSLTPALNGFYNALQDANSDPASLANREIVIEQASSLANRFQGMQQQLDGLQDEVNDRLSASVNDINDIASEIAEINKRIVSSKGALQGHDPNRLLDERDLLIANLSRIADVRTTEQDDGSSNVFVGNGVALVVGAQAQQLRTVQDTSNSARLEIEIGENNHWQATGSLIQGGSLGGLRDFEKNTLNPTMHELGRMALVFADTINTQHQQGIDLNGNAGTSLFTLASPEIISSSLNTGTGSVTATIDNVNSLEASDYQVRFDGSGFTTTRVSDGQQSSGPLPVIIDGIQISISGSPAAGDTFVVSPTRKAAAFIDNTITSVESLALASPLASSSSLDNTGTARIALSAILDPQDPNFTNSVELVFLSDNTLEVRDTTNSTTLATGLSYTPGATLQFNGWEAVIDGDAKSGDVYQIEAASSNNGSNGNGLAMLELQTAEIISGNQSINDNYGTLVSRIGGQNRSLQTRSATLENLNTSALERQQSVQGVNLDEEAVNLTRYQQAYQASAQIIATADTLFQTLIGVVAR